MIAVLIIGAVIVGACAGMFFGSALRGGSLAESFAAGEQAGREQLRREQREADAAMDAEMDALLREWSA